jgi:hypothetical protein
LRYRPSPSLAAAHGRHRDPTCQPYISLLCWSRSSAGPCRCQPDLTRESPPLRALPSPLACLSSPDLPLICLLRRDEEEEIRVGAGGWKERRWQTVESEWKGGVGTSSDAQRQGASPCLIKKRFPPNQKYSRMGLLCELYLERKSSSWYSDCDFWFGSLLYFTRRSCANGLPI